jgi:soluble lytic murein transglycosylase
VQLGTKYFRWLLDSLGDHPEEALAAFNAGKSRVDLWSTWGPYSEPSEFIETIPFTQTREYVQVVLRNAEVYQRLYAGVPALDGEAAPVHKTTVREKSVAKKPASKKPAQKTTAPKR